MGGCHSLGWRGGVVVAGEARGVLLGFAEEGSHMGCGLGLDWDATSRGDRG